MRSITVTLWVTLDGVVQGLGRPDEDTRGGFTYGGWGQRYNDEVMGREMAEAMAKPGDMLFGRRTWQDFITAWGGLTDGNPITTRMNTTTKYVASRTLEDADAWQNSILLRGDAAGTVAALKAQSGRDLGIVGSVSLVRSLHAAALIDRYTLLMCPLTLGRGARLFEGPAPLTEFELTGSVVTTKGVIIAQYTRRDGQTVTVGDRPDEEQRNA
jgi:dihydrofolate reductase